MNTELLRQLPLVTSSFERLRQLDQIYVDKTKKVYSLACCNGKYFLARPRRFGKSLLISTFESLFKYGLRDFHGLEIEKLWKEDKEFLVVKLDFSEAKSFRILKEFELQFHDLIVEAFAPYGVSIAQTYIFQLKPLAHRFFNDFFQFQLHKLTSFN